MNLHVVDAIAKASRYIDNTDEPIVDIVDPLAYFAQRLDKSTATHALFQIDLPQYTPESIGDILKEQTAQIVVIAFSYNQGRFWPQIPDDLANYKALGVALYPEVNSTRIQVLVKDRGCYFLHDQLDSCHLVDKEKLETAIMKGKVVFAVFERREE